MQVSQGHTEYIFFLCKQVIWCTYSIPLIFPFLCYIETLILHISLLNQCLLVINCTLSTVVYKYKIAQGLFLYLINSLHVKTKYMQIGINIYNMRCAEIKKEQLISFIILPKLTPLILYFMLRHFTNTLSVQDPIIID